MLRRLLLIICAAPLLGNAHAQQKPAVAFNQELSRGMASRVHYSLSKQFIIHSQPRTGWLPSLGPAPDVVRLEPNLLAISCERIKRAVMKELGVTSDVWRGKIELQLHPARNLGETIHVTSTQHANDWSYRVELPDAIERPQLVSAVVELLLLEMANRSSSGRSAEIPAWLTQGLTRQLLVQREVELVLQPPNQMESGVAIARLVRSEQRTNSLTRAHEELSSQSPLTLEQLSWPGEDQFTGSAGEAYRSSAQLLVCELERLQNGRAGLQAFLGELPQHLNWQIAFLKAFHARFATQRDLEKWWALRLENFTARDLAQTWSSDESWKKLDEIIRPPVQVRTAANELPLHTEVTLQTILRQWDFPRQTRIIQAKLQQLALIRVRVSQDSVPFVDGYRQALETYLKNRNKGGLARLIMGMSAPRLERIVQESVRELDGLDARREELRPKPEPANRPKIDTASILATH
jgi:hypothetical protein